MLPDLSDVAEVAGVDAPVVHTLKATYLDTADLRLLSRGWLLRRRTGGTDAGWHLLKRPAGNANRDEATLPLGRSATRVPPAMQRAVAVHTRGRPLVAIARLTTRRTVSAVRDASGEPLAEVMLDAVHAVALTPTGTVQSERTWWELEVELADGDRRLLRRIGARLIAAGASPSDRPAKLVQALHDRLAAEPLPAHGPPVRFGSRTAVGVVLVHLHREVARLHANDVAVRNDAAEGVHQMRVASRQLRSTLATFRPLFDRQVTDPIRDELAWFAGTLGAARDVEVVRSHLIAALADQPEALRHGPIEQRIATTLAERFRVARSHGLDALSSPRYFALLDSLDRLIAEPPLAPGAEAKGLKTLRTLTRRTWRALVRLHTALAAAGDDEARDACLHEIRKAAKRARYAGEALAPTMGRTAQRYAEVTAAIQDALGDHQDAVVARQELLLLAGEAAAAGEPTFTYGRLHALEAGRASRAERDCATLWHTAGRKEFTAWLR